MKNKSRSITVSKGILPARPIPACLRHFFACLCVLMYQATQGAGTDTYWGVIDVDQQSIYYVSGTDITQNFTDQYSFSIAGTESAEFQTAVYVDFCTSGCGNVVASYGIYDANGGLISDSGAAALNTGDYIFQVRATGMGSGNSLDYTGAVEFSNLVAETGGFISPAPEPHDFLLIFVGTTFLTWALRRRRMRPTGLVRLVCQHKNPEPR